MILSFVGNVWISSVTTFTKILIWNSMILLRKIVGICRLIYFRLKIPLTIFSFRHNLRNLTNFLLFIKSKIAISINMRLFKVLIFAKIKLGLYRSFKIRSSAISLISFSKIWPCTVSLINGILQIVSFRRLIFGFWTADHFCVETIVSWQSSFSKRLLVVSRAS